MRAAYDVSKSHEVGSQLTTLLRYKAQMIQGAVDSIQNSGASLYSTIIALRAMYT